jgi:hypothetical protein
MAHGSRDMKPLGHHDDSSSLGSKATQEEDYLLLDGRYFKDQPYSLVQEKNPKDLSLATLLEHYTNNAA